MKTYEMQLSQEEYITVQMALSLLCVIFEKDIKVPKVLETARMLLNDGPFRKIVE